MNKIHLGVLFSVLLITMLPACTESWSSGADRVFVSGAIYTADESRSWAEAVVVAGGEFANTMEILILRLI